MINRSEGFCRYVEEAYKREDVVDSMTGLGT